MIFAIVNNISQRIVAKFDAKDSMDCMTQFAKSKGFENSSEMFQQEPLLMMQHSTWPIQ